MTAALVIAVIVALGIVLAVLDRRRAPADTRDDAEPTDEFDAESPEWKS